MNNDLSILKPLTLPNGTVIKNRFFKSAMSEAMSTRHHAPNQFFIEAYKEWALGGAGIVMTGNVMVDRNALGEPRNIVIEDERDLTMLKAWAKAGTINNTHLWMQLNHPGKQSPRSLSKTPVAPSAIPLSEKLRKFFNPPRALTIEEIKNLVTRFVKTAKIAKKAGFTGIQIHAAHGYLISQFLSPYDNQRSDEYGGSLDNRMRFLVEIYQGLRDALGTDYPIGIKLNAKDFNQEGLNEDDSLKIVEKLTSLGIDLIEISGGNYENPMMSTGQNDENNVFFLEFAKKLKAVVDVPLVVTGGFRKISVMEEALKSNHTSMIGIARPLALYPDIPNQVIEGTYQTVTTKRLKTGIKFIDQSFGAIIGNSYYEQQIHRLGKGKPPRIHQNGWKPLLYTLFTHGPRSFIKRRAR